MVESGNQYTPARILSKRFKKSLAEMISKIEKWEYPNHVA